MKDDTTKTREELLEELTRLRARLDEVVRSSEARDILEEVLLAKERDQRRFGQSLMALVQLTNELSLCPSIDELCRKAVDLGRGRLGVDRLGIWFRAPEGEIIVGSYGVDHAGHIVDERSLRRPIDATAPDGRVLTGQEPLVKAGEIPVPTPAGGVQLLPEQAFAAIWDGSRVMGHISADNRPHGAPLSHYSCELLRLFGATLGYLCARKRAEEQRERVIEDLQDALGKIRTLRGLLPICASCKRVRDDTGYWNQIEQYVQEHSEAAFSHGVCPECARKLYPGLMDDAGGSIAEDGRPGTDHGGRHG